GQIDFCSRNAEPISGLDVAPFGNRREGKGLLDAAEARAPQSFFRFPQHGSCLRMPDLATLATQLHLQTRTRTVLLADIECERSLADLEHLALDLRKEPN